MAMKLTVIGCSPAWPNPGGAHSGYLVEGPGRLLLDCGPGVLPRLREAETWPQRGCDRDHALPPRPLGRPRPWVWGTMYGLGAEGPQPELWLPPGGGDHLATLGSRLGFPDMFERTFRICHYEGGTPFVAAGLTVTALRLPHYTLETYGLRVANDTAHARLLGRRGSERAAGRARPRRRTSSSARRRSSAASWTASRAGICLRTRRSRRSRRQVRAGCS